MVSKIITLEKKRQEDWFRIVVFVTHEAEHKQSLINLKEYMEETKLWKNLFTEHYEQLDEDIAELNNMIEKYGR